MDRKCSPSVEPGWLRGKDSNLDYQGQNLVSYL